MLYNVDFLNGIFVYGFLHSEGSEKKFGECVRDFLIILIRSFIVNRYLQEF